MNKELFNTYAQLERQKREIEQQQLNLKPMLVADMTDNDVKIVKGELGRFNLIMRASWQFSPIVEQLAKNLDEKKAEEKAKGTATKIETLFLMFTPTKKETNDNE